MSNNVDDVLNMPWDDHELHEPLYYINGFDVISVLKDMDRLSGLEIDDIR